MIYLPFPPSANSLWRSNRGRVHKSERYQQWIQLAGWILKGQNPKPVKGRFEIMIKAERPDKRLRDLDNLTKSSLDLLALHRIIENDHLAEKITLEWIRPGKQIYIYLNASDAQT